MFTLAASWTMIPATIAFVTSAFLSRELARRKERDEYFYFFVGLVLGPLALMIVLTPLPDEEGGRAQKKPLRYVKGKPCPHCHREVALRITRCPHCRHEIDSPWWDNPVSYNTL